VVVVGRLSAAHLYHFLNSLLLLLYDGSLALKLALASTALKAVKHVADSLVKALLSLFLLQRFFAEGADQALVQPLCQAVRVENMPCVARSFCHDVFCAEPVQTDDARLCPSH